MSTDAAIGSLVAAGLVAIALVTTGGVDLGPNTWTEIVLIAIGAGVAIALLLLGARGRRWGGYSVLLFAGLVVLTALSVTWSVKPDASWTEAGRTLSYFAVFGSSVALARVAPGRWAAVLGGVGAGATAICAYALLAKVFPAALDPSETFGRLRAPFDYWNATGLVGALGLPPCLWAGARREGGKVLRALSIPAVAILISVIVLSYSRGAVIVGVAGLAVFFALVPCRLRAALTLTVGALGATAISLYAIGTHALTGNLETLSARSTAGHAFGLLLALVLGLLALAGFATAFASDRARIRDSVRRRIAVALLVAVALIPVAAVAGFATSSRGLTGEVSHMWSTLTGTSAVVATSSPNRLVQLGNSRGRYWREGLKVGEHALLAGTGALGYGTAVTRYTYDPRIVAHAHSYLIETFADFGLIGVALMAAMLAAWAVAARRSLRRPTIQTDALDAERAGLQTMLALVITFGVHSAIDWTWFVPGTAIPAMICAGWLAGRGPLDAPTGTRPRTRLSQAPGTAALAIGIVAATVLAAWAIWQPQSAADANAAALTAASNGEIRAAIGDARAGADRNPVGVDSLFELAALYEAAGDPQAAGAQLRQAVARQPENAQTWLDLGEFEGRTGHPQLAIAPLKRARLLDLSSYQAVADLARANKALGGSR